MVEFWFKLKMKEVSDNVEIPSGGHVAPSGGPITA